MTNRRTEFMDLVNGKETTVPFLTAAWQHFNCHENDPEDFAQHSIDFVEKWDWDWVKINPRATYYSEVWGSTYDPNEYGPSDPIQKQLSAAITEPAEVSKIDRIALADSPVFMEHVKGAMLIRKHFEDRVVVMTMFSPLSILLQCAGMSLYKGDAIYGSTTDFGIKELIFDQPQAAKQALQSITDSCIEYVQALVAPYEEGGAGLDGIFFAVTGTASNGYFSKEQFDEFSRPYDMQVLAAVKDKVSVFHTCRMESHPEWFSDYPIDAIHWDQFMSGNPPIDEDLGIVPIGGVNFTQFAPSSDLDEVRTQLDRTMEEREGKPFLLAPSCTIPTPASDEALELLRTAGH
ncbi:MULTISPECIES: uroporphyrinogen decarboxylase family protein [Bifidobacterium]|jgi:uroporphyrinogen decarboxylase|uniref:Uroporphyrinogen decarboxylase n=1 Tax=Bifidobacterium tibiigranuli TaxID=2172043 RepID=A0A5N6S3I2_9BIFI|nr:uroporphyrinogen decarboxylase family protein [Bifidobacterium tibiigranuli]KAE8128009.1 uroporphyrinogen decarboxylase [Bifidobacterium tibiigranuli]KAE8128170.1 uroporphyrinogen decarboxylase [Bifidobacterium tibiigranuli]MCH3974106.1 uroporphyrinogen decarboxylase [Bifidobacterium tibiigranuli]MCH4189136.1 uroporphyrinogen decarboxylase [Bifidobacterium tibiigranuli]MCH4204096.1 uroporphyrinogen decarboxylase [Bifidobacterium tibiigranuli]